MTKNDIKSIKWGLGAIWRKSQTRRSPSFPQIHEKYIYTWNCSYRTPTECWQKTSDLPKGKKLLVLQPGIRAVPLRWESQLQDTGPQETSQLHVIPNSENLPELSISTSRPSFTQRPASYSAGHPMPNN